MRKVLPVIPADVEPLKQRMQRDRHGRKKPQLQILSLLASDQAQTRRAVARCWGSTARPSAMGSPATRRVAWTRCWLWISRRASPARSPRMCWLRLRRRSGSRPGLPPLKRCAHGSSRPIIWRSTIIRSIPVCGPGSGPRARGRGPVPQKTPDAMPAFQATWRAPRQRVIPPENTRPVRICSQDESRVGVLTVRRRRLTAGVVHPLAQSSTSSHGAMSMAREPPP